MLNKKEIRTLVLQKRKSLNKNQIKNFSKQCFTNFYTNKKLKDLVLSKKNIAIYFAHQGEISCLDFANFFFQEKKTLLLPQIQTKNNINYLTFAKFNQNDANNLCINKYKIKELKELKDIKPDVIFTPLVAFDKNLNRLGMGKGYYDATFSLHKNSIKIGLAYTFQCFEKILKEKFDVPLDYVLTDQDIFCKSSIF